MKRGLRMTKVVVVLASALDGSSELPDIVLAS